MYKLGNFELYSVDTCIFGLDGGAMFGVVPKNIWSKKYHSGDSQNRIPLAARPLLVIADDKKILIDTGNGTKYNEKLQEIYNINIEESDIEKSLKKIGFSTDEITEVILTHLHFDHSGGNTIYEDGELIPTFKNAKYYVQKSHYNWAINPTEKDRASFMQENYKPLLDNGVLEFLDGDGELFKGINLHIVNGHTKSLQMVELVSDGQKLLYLADLCPTNAHLNIAYAMAYDNFPLTTIEERKYYYQKCYEEDIILFFEHDAFIKAGKIDKTDKGYFIKQTIDI